MAPPENPGDGERLCTSCGICCTGAIFEYVAIEARELERARRHLPVIAVDTPNGAGHRVDFPCSRHDGERCTIYADRPALCAEYECVLYKKVAEGTFTIEDALRIVADARATIARLDTALPRSSSSNESIWARARALHLASEGSVDQRRAIVDTLLDLAALERMLVIHFDERAGRQR